MTDTEKKCESVKELRMAVKDSVERQYMVAHEESIDQPVAENSSTRYVCSGKRSFEAAKAYRGKKTAVLNFANNHAIGGSPFSAGAQEESLCRCSTLYPCLQAMREQFYEKHSRQFRSKEIGYMGNDDLIYTPDVVVFKTDERTDPNIPCMMDQEDWYKVDVITCAAPELRHTTRKPQNYEEIITRRIKKILDVAAREGVEVLILGAWGCGAFGNKPHDVAGYFKQVLIDEGYGYFFDEVRFAIYGSENGKNISEFRQTFG
jgi:uncharacterized protein (TIGR02452 family)